MRLHFPRAAIRVDTSFVFLIAIGLLTVGSGNVLELPRTAAELLLVLAARELGHAAAWRALGRRPRVVLHGFGGETTVSDSSLGGTLLGLAAGPVLVLALGAGAHFLGLSRLAWLAGGWGVFSLLPMQPMPGGRMVAALLHRPFPVAAQKLSYLLSLPVALGSFLYLLSLQAPAAALLVAGVAFALAVAALFELRLRTRDLALADRFALAWTALGARRLDEAKALIDELGQVAHSTARRAELRRLTAWLCLAAGQLDEAETQIARLPIGHEAESALIGALYLKRGRFLDAVVPLHDAYEEQPSDHAAALLARALLGVGGLDEATRLLDDAAAGPELFDVLMEALFHAGRLDEAAHVGERSWAMAHAPRLAFNLGCTHARLGRPEVALGWLSHALDQGWRDLRGLDEDPDLAALRTRPEWEPLRARLTSLGRAG